MTYESIRSLYVCQIVMRMDVLIRVTIPHRNTLNKGTIDKIVFFSPFRGTSNGESQDRPMRTGFVLNV